jgi:hypothetical protein
MRENGGRGKWDKGCTDVINPVVGGMHSAMPEKKNF